jgi:hypothetical protein
MGTNMKTSLAKRKSAIKSQEKQIVVYLKPCNEKQELNYQETFIGTAKEILERSLEIIHGLNSVLRYGTFSVKIERSDLTQSLYLDSEYLFNNNFDVIGVVDEFSKSLNTL